MDGIEMDEDSEFAQGEGDVAFIGAFGSLGFWLKNEEGRKENDK